MLGEGKRKRIIENDYYNLFFLASKTLFLPTILLRIAILGLIRVLDKEKNESTSLDLCFASIEFKLKLFSHPFLKNNID